jgi:hypothetical protein
MQRLLGCVAAAAIAACSHAHAAQKAPVMMTIDFVGDWCSPTQDGNITDYTLPSWTEGGHCTDILSINKYGWYNDGGHCEPITMRLSTDTAPSGTGYTAVVTARCQPDGPVTAGTLKTFEFHRYKGRLSIKGRLSYKAKHGTLCAVSAVHPVCGSLGAIWSG